MRQPSVVWSTGMMTAPARMSSEREREREREKKGERERERGGKIEIRKGPEKLTRREEPNLSQAISERCEHGASRQEQMGTASPDCRIYSRTLAKSSTRTAVLFRRPP